jgi:hypothetical protein
MTLYAANEFMAENTTATARLVDGEHGRLKTGTYGVCTARMTILLNP